MQVEGSTWLVVRYKPSRLRTRSDSGNKLRKLTGDTPFILHVNGGRRYREGASGSCTLAGDLRGCYAKHAYLRDLYI
jgi:hypothetical protein